LAHLTNKIYSLVNMKEDINLNSYFMENMQLMWNIGKYLNFNNKLKIYHFGLTSKKKFQFSQKFNIKNIWIIITIKEIRIMHFLVVKLWQMKHKLDKKIKDNFILIHLIPKNKINKIKLCENKLFFSSYF